MPHRGQFEAALGRATGNIVGRAATRIAPVDAPEWPFAPLLLALRAIVLQDVTGRAAALEPAAQEAGACGQAVPLDGALGELRARVAAAEGTVGAAETLAWTDMPLVLRDRPAGEGGERYCRGHNPGRIRRWF